MQNQIKPFRKFKSKKKNYTNFSELKEDLSTERKTKEIL